MEEVLIEPYITIKLDSQQTSVVSDWTGSPTTEQFKVGKNKVLSVLSDKGSSIMVLNYQNMTAYLNLETQVWTINDWFPRVLKEDNIKRVGVVIPDKVVAQIVVKSIFAGAQAELAKSGVEIGYFDNITQLQDWLDGKSTSSSISHTSSTSSSSTTPSAFGSTKPPTPNTTIGGVDMGKNNPPPMDYGSIDDVIHDDPFA